MREMYSRCGDLTREIFAHFRTTVGHEPSPHLRASASRARSASLPAADAQPAAPATARRTPRSSERQDRRVYRRRGAPSARAPDQRERQPKRLSRRREEGEKGAESGVMAAQRSGSERAHLSVI